MNCERCGRPVGTGTLLGNALAFCGKACAWQWAMDLPITGEIGDAVFTLYDKDGSVAFR